MTDLEAIELATRRAASKFGGNLAFALETLAEEIALINNERAEAEKQLRREGYENAAQT